MRRKVIVLGLGALVSVMVLLLWRFNPEIFLYALQKRSVKIAVMLLVALATSMSTVLFQTVTSNRILTPSVLGLDSLYVLLNLLLVAVFGTYTRWLHNPYLNFALSTALMLVFSFVFYQMLFKRVKSIYTLVLIGMVMGMFFQSITGMLQIVLNPDAFTFVMDKLFASFMDVKPTLLGLSFAIVLLVLILVVGNRHLLDVMSLGKDHALNLGIAYNSVVRTILMGVFLLLSVSTALVGPITFLGFFSVNLCKSLLKTHRHDVILAGTTFIAVIMLFVSQFFVEYLFNYGLPVSVVINLIGGGYFILLLLKENKR